MKITPSLQRSVETTAPKVSQFVIVVVWGIVFAELDPKATEQCHLISFLSCTHYSILVLPCRVSSAANISSCLVFPRLKKTPTPIDIQSYGYTESNLGEVMQEKLQPKWGPVLFLGKSWEFSKSQGKHENHSHQTIISAFTFRFLGITLTSKATRTFFTSHTCSPESQK